MNPSDKGLDIEALIAKLEGSKETDRELSLNIDSMLSMKDSELAELIFLQARACVQYWGSGNNPRFDGNTEKAIDSYLMALKTQSPDRVIKFLLNAGKQIDPVAEIPKNLAAFHYAMLIGRFPDNSFEDLTSGLEQFLKDKSQSSRKTYRLISNVSSILNAVGEKTYKLITTSARLVLYTSVAVIVAVATLDYASKSDTYKKVYNFLMVHPISDIRGTVEVNEPNKVGQSSPQIASYYARFDRDPKIFDYEGKKYAGVFLRYGDCLFNIREYFSNESNPIDYNDMYLNKDGELKKIPNNPSTHRRLPSNVMVCWPVK